MILPVLAVLLALAIPQQTGVPPSPTAVASQTADTSKAQRPHLDKDKFFQQAMKRREIMRQAAVRLNDLATSIHSEQDARVFIDAVADALWGKHLFGWTTRRIRYRVAHAEFGAVSDAARAIPEQRIVDVWNEYVREIDAPEEELVTVAEIHNMRDGMYVFDQHSWEQKIQSIWTVPSIHALDADGKLADGCRAIEALKIIHSLYFEPESLPFARERVQQEYLPSQSVGLERTKAPMKSGGVLVGRSYSNPIQTADRRYLQNHGDLDYDRMLMRLFDELFPKE